MQIEYLTRFKFYFLQIKDTWANPNDYVKNHFRNNKKKKFDSIYIFKSIFTI